MNSLNGTSLGLGIDPVTGILVIGSIVGAAAGEIYGEWADYKAPAPCPPGVMPNADGTCQDPSVYAPHSQPSYSGGGGGGGGEGSSYKPPASTPVTAPPPAPVESEFPWKWAIAGMIAVFGIGSALIGSRKVEER